MTELLSLGTATSTGEYLHVSQLVHFLLRLNLSSFQCLLSLFSCSLFDSSQHSSSVTHCLAENKGSAVGDKWLAHFWIQSKVLKGKQKDLIFLMQMCRLNPSCHVCSCSYAPLSKALFCTWEGLTTCLKKKLQNYRNRNPGGFLSPVILSEGFQLGSKQWPMWCWDLLPFVIDLVWKTAADLFLVCFQSQALVVHSATNKV